MVTVAVDVTPFTISLVREGEGPPLRRPQCVAPAAADTDEGHPSAPFVEMVLPLMDGVAARAQRAWAAQRHRPGAPVPEVRIGAVTSPAVRPASADRLVVGEHASGRIRVACLRRAGVGRDRAAVVHRQDDGQRMCWMIVAPVARVRPGPGRTRCGPPVATCGRVDRGRSRPLNAVAFAGGVAEPSSQYWPPVTLCTGAVGRGRPALCLPPRGRSCSG